MNALHECVRGPIISKILWLVNMFTLQIQRPGKIDSYMNRGQTNRNIKGNIRCLSKTSAIRTATSA